MKIKHKGKKMENLLLTNNKTLKLKFVSPKEKITLESLKKWEVIRSDSVIDSNYYNEVRKILKQLPKVEYEIHISSY